MTYSYDILITVQQWQKYNLGRDFEQMENTAYLVPWPVVSVNCVHFHIFILFQYGMSPDKCCWDYFGIYD